MPHFENINVYVYTHLDDASIPENAAKIIVEPVGDDEKVRDEVLELLGVVDEFCRAHACTYSDHIDYEYMSGAIIVYNIDDNEVNELRDLIGAEDKTIVLALTKESTH